MLNAIQTNVGKRVEEFFASAEEVIVPKNPEPAKHSEFTVQPWLQNFYLRLKHLYTSFYALDE